MGAAEDAHDPVTLAREKVRLDPLAGPEQGKAEGAGTRLGPARGRLRSPRGAARSRAPPIPQRGERRREKGGGHEGRDQYVHRASILGSCLSP